MAGRGGYQPPEKPAGVSGPGKYSQRTDGTAADVQKRMRFTGEPWGENGELNSIATAAPMHPHTPAQPQATPAQMGSAAPAPTPVPLSAPSQNPDEPITAGMPFGAGAGPEALTHATETNPANDPVAAVVRAFYAQTGSPFIGALVSQLEQQGR